MGRTEHLAEGLGLPAPDEAAEDAASRATGDDAHGDLRLPGVFGRPGALEELHAAVTTARDRLARSDGGTARQLVVSALRGVLEADWGIWDGSQAKTLDLLWETGGVGDVTRALGPLIGGTRFADDWQIVGGLLPGAMRRLDASDRRRVVATVVDHISSVSCP